MGVQVGRADNLAINIDDRSAVAEWPSVLSRLKELPTDQIAAEVDTKAIGRLKFSECLPQDLAVKELQARLTDRASAELLTKEYPLTITD